jgi:2-deoxystreptamine N-acetyl-D-glucosaminyltransferase/2-deoxystreptamine glucosyltransferase
VDAVICHGHPVAALAAAPLTRGFGIPYILVTHGDIFDRPRGTYDPLLTRFYRRVTRPAYRRAACIVALSPHMQSLAVARGGAPDRVAVIPNGLDPAEIGLTDTGADRSVPEHSSGPLRLLYVGRLSVEKGGDILIDAAARLKEQGVPFNLRIAGTGPEEARLRAQARAGEVDDSIDFLGKVPRRQLGTLYCSADVVCVPSRSDTLPTVVLEAMAAGVAVVGSDAGGIPFLLGDGAAGWVFPSEESSALASILKACWEDPRGLTQKRQRAFLQIRNRLTWSANARALRSLIHDKVR